MVRLLIASAVLALVCTAASGAVVIDAGFESYDVSSGQFVKPTSGAWAFDNDAGVVQPFAPNSSTTSLFTWSATRPAYEGAQYASTYAGADTILQRVTFDAPGRYEMSVAAFAPDGEVYIFPNDPSPMTLEDGAFQFWFGGNPVGPQWIVPMRRDWAVYSTVFDVSAAGTYPVGIANSHLAPYFVNYDAFQIRLVPEPASAGVAMVVMACWSVRRPRRRWTSGRRAA